MAPETEDETPDEISRDMADKQNIGKQRTNDQAKCLCREDEGDEFATIFTVRVLTNQGRANGIVTTDTYTQNKTED